MKPQNLLPIVFILILTACGPASSVSQTPIPPLSVLPDLVISGMQLAMQGMPPNAADCVNAYAPYEVRGTIQNRGQAPARGVTVAELSTGYTTQIAELAPGQSAEVIITISSPTGVYNLVVDPQNLVGESDESNNQYSYQPTTPTPPVLCQAGGTPDTPPPAGTSGGQSGSAVLSPTVLANAVYRSPDWDEFQLTDGVFYRTPPTSQESPDAYTTRMQDPIIYGDINGDGLEDALVILNTQNGGSGHAIELAAVLDQNGAPYNVSTISLGDRVVVESGHVENSIIMLDMRVHSSSDGLCCPSLPVSWNFMLRADQLIKLQ